MGLPLLPTESYLLILKFWRMQSAQDATKPIQNSKIHLAPHYAAPFIIAMTVRKLLNSSSLSKFSQVFMNKFRVHKSNS